MPARTLTEAEYTGLRDSVLKAAPSGLSESDFQRYIGPALEQAVGTAEHSAEPVQGSAIERFAEGAWKNLNPAGLVSAIAHPADTVKSIIDAHAAQLDKAKTAYAEGRYSEAAGHIAASALPVIGPAAANAGERIASGDVAGGLGEGAALVAGVETPRLVKGAARGVNAVATKVAESAAAQNAIGATGGAAAGASMGHPYIGLAIGSKYGAPLVKSVAEGVQAVTGGAPAAGAALSDLELARQEVAAGRLAPAVLRGMERQAELRAARRPAAPVARPAAPVALAAEPIATPEAASPASPVISAPSFVIKKGSSGWNVEENGKYLGTFDSQDSAARFISDQQTRVSASAAPANAYPDQKALNEAALAKRRAAYQASQAAPAPFKPGVTPIKLTAAEVAQGLKWAKAGVPEAEILQRIEESRAFAAKMNLSSPTVAETKFPKGMRGGAGSQSVTPNEPPVATAAPAREATVLPSGTQSRLRALGVSESRIGDLTIEEANTLLKLPKSIIGTSDTITDARLDELLRRNFGGRQR